MVTTGKVRQRTADGLRDALFDLLDGLREGTVKQSQARVQCEVAKQIIETVKMELTQIAVLRQNLELEKLARKLLANSEDQ